MGNDPSASVLRQIDQLFSVGTLSGMSDAELLARFAARDAGSESAFAALVTRHGSMVLGACRRILRDAHSAEDAFQATFLLLARRADTLRVPHTLGPWLHQVAYRTACKARTAAARRSARERRVAAEAPTMSEPYEPADDVGLILHAEIDRLPASYRTVVVTCYLDGLTHEQAAARLGWPIGTVCGRLARARRRLKTILIERGLAPAIIGGLFAATAADAAPSAQLVERVARAAAATFEASACVNGAAGLFARSSGIGRINGFVIVALGVACASAGVAALAWGHAPNAGANPQSSAGQPVEVAAQRVQPETPQRLDRRGDPLPPAAIARLGMQRFQNADRIESIAYTPDGRAIISASGRLIQMWDASSGRALRHFDDDRSWVKEVTIAPDGKTIAYLARMDDNLTRIVVQDARTGHAVRGMASRNGEFSALRYSPDGKFLAARYHGDGLPPSIKIYDAATLDERSGITPVLNDRHPSVSTLGFLPDSVTLMVVGDFGAVAPEVQFWDIASSQRVRAFSARGFDRGLISISPDSQVLAMVFPGGEGGLRAAIRMGRGSPAGTLGFTRDEKEYRGSIPLGRASVSWAIGFGTGDRASPV